MTQLPPPLAPLLNYPQFIPYKLVPKPNGKTTKIPLDHRTGDAGDPTDPALWMTFDQCSAYSDKIGFVFTKDDPFFFLDIDGAYDAATGQWSEIANYLVQQFNGAAVEVSQSGKGLHIFGTGTVPEHSCKYEPLGLELYTDARFCAMTGNSAQGDIMSDHSPALSVIAPHYFPPGVKLDDTKLWTAEPCDDWAGPTDDDELLRRALKSKSMANRFGDKASFKDLFERNVDVLGKCYPDHDGDRPYGESNADSAIAQHLAFWTGNDCERIERIMRKSALVRDKWARVDYMKRTILKATSGQTSFYNDPKAKEAAPRDLEAEAGDLVTEPGVLRSGTQFMPASGQLEHFKSCVYVSHLHKVLTPSGEMLKPDRFRVRYGGYLFSMDSANDKTSKNAWEVFTESQALHFPKVDRATFRPREEPASIFEDEGLSFVNTYVPCPVKRVEGDAAPFYELLAKLLPDERDRAILLAYMAAVVQYQGIKFQWCPLIQGVEGNGKTLLTRAVMAAVGKRYTHMPPANDISNNFNAWILNRTFIGIEDIYSPENPGILEALKPMITNDYQSATLKGVDQEMADICANFIMNSNYKDAVMKTRNDRRFGIFYTAQQCVEDLLRDGMGPEYMSKLYDWFNNGGSAIITEMLYTYNIPNEFNPAYGGRAPETTSTAEAIELCLSPVQQEIVEAAEAGRVGFMGGWLSSIHLETLLSDMRVKLSSEKRKKLIADLGYITHPGLDDGRACNPVPLDMGRKPRLYIKKGQSIAQELTSPKDIVNAYVAAQSAHTEAVNEAAFTGGATG